MDLSQYADLFRAETREHLGAFNQLLLSWEQDPANAEPVAGIFRAVHTVKGMAATMGYAKVADLAHRAESLLDLFRDGSRPAESQTLEVLFATADAMEALVEATVTGGEDSLDVTALLDALDEAARAHQTPEEQAAPRRRISFVGAQPGVGRRVEVVIAPDSPLKGARALLALERAKALGPVHGVEPAPAAFETDTFDGRFAFRVESGLLAHEIEEAIRRAGDIERVDVDVEQQSEDARAGASRGRHIRVDLKRLDRLMNLIGEAVTARGRLAHIAARYDDAPLDDVAVKIAQLTSDLQSEIIQARMTPVWQVFDRFPRLVRDLSKQLDKPVNFQVEGKEIELDRAILDELSDPLVHLLRNALDHGIESPDERVRAGKPREGTLTLAALRERASVAIVVADDGRGIDRTRILREAKRQGVVDQDVEALSDDMLLRVLSRSGFSTAEHVSGISGRGVGVDIVVTRVRHLGGSLELKSEPGHGTTFTLRLPVTLAIVRALLARVGGEQYALPLTHVMETVELAPGASTRLDGREALMLREEVLPLVHLRELLGVADVVPRGRRPVIVLSIGDRRGGLVVDQMMGQQEIVVKSFEPPRGTLPVFSGATILGDGEPVLILDAGGLV
ncbi:MAG: chemotaxis protein CheA [Gemmatimonadales bacterium]